MKADWVLYVTALATLAAACAAEELFPKFGGAGFPFLLMASLYWAYARARRAALVFAVAAGAAADSLSMLPFFASISYFVLAVMFVIYTGFAKSAFAFAYPLYQVWLRMWCSDLDGTFATRLVVAFPFGIATALMAVALLCWLDRKGALDG